MADRFKDKVAIVTGGASGIGRALSEALYRRGSRVVVADIDLARAQHVAASFDGPNGHARAAAVDVTRPDLMKQLVTDTVSSFGRLDYMFNNAAATATRGELRDLPLEPWHRAIDVNLLGVVHGAVTAYSVMIRQGYGHIVNIASIAGLVGFPTSIPYSATKAAVVNLSFSLRAEAAAQGVKVSVVCPGPIHGEKERVELMGVERAAQLILRGVERNQGIIVFPFSARLLWWIYRLWPNLVLPIGRRITRDYDRKHHGFLER